MWRDHEEMRAIIDEYAHKADILKLSEDELILMTPGNYLRKMH